MKILYISPLIPAVSGSGGKKAAFGHLMDIMKTTKEIDLLLIDVESSGEALHESLAALRVQILPRAIPSTRSLSGKIYSVIQLLFDKRPRSVAVVASRAGRLAVKSKLALAEYDAIIVEHLNGWGLLQGVKTKTPILYILQNIEADVIGDEWSQCRIFSPNWFRLWLEYIKTSRYESVQWSRATTLIAISSSDGKSKKILNQSHKIVVWPELPESKIIKWSGNGAKVLLFVGSARYFPNRDAINWLVRDFMPVITELAPDVVLRIAGTASSDVKHLSPSSRVVFEGFVSAQRLDELHRTSDVFVSPVVLGSGVKIKVLEASSYGLPIAATEGSLRGIEYLKGAALQINRDPMTAAQEVLGLLEDTERQAQLSAQGLAQLALARERRPHLLELGMRLEYEAGLTVTNVKRGIAQ